MPIPTKPSVGEVIGSNARKIRESRDLSQDDVARKADMTTNHYSRLERGEVDTPGADMALKIAQALEVPVSKLYEGAE